MIVDCLWFTGKKQDDGNLPRALNSTAVVVHKFVHFNLYYTEQR